MKKSLEKLSDIEKKYLISLVSDAEKRDADIAREIGVSKATTGRIGKKLHSIGLIQSMLPIVDLDMLGVDFFAVIIFSWNKFSSSEETNKMEKSFTKTPNVVYFSGGDSSDGMSHLLMAGFTNMPEYHDFMKDFRGKYEESISDYRSFFIPSDKIIKQDYAGLVKKRLMESGGKK